MVHSEATVVVVVVLVVSLPTHKPGGLIQIVVVFHET